MLNLTTGTFQLCDGATRRGFLKIGSLGLGGLSLATPGLIDSSITWAGSGRRLPRGEAANTTPSKTVLGSKRPTSVILFWMAGGPSHHETYDMKPEATEQIRGPFRPIGTNVRGLDVCELLPAHARIADKFSLIRSMTHGYGVHDDAQHLVQTGYPCLNARDKGQQHPAQGAVVSQEIGPRVGGMPAYVCIPESYSSRKGFYQKAAFLSSRFEPLNAGGDPALGNYRAPELSLPAGLTLSRLAGRRQLLDSIDNVARTAEASPAVRSMNEIHREAFELVTGSKARTAFDVTRETDALRDRYGRHAWGHAALLSRRLVEAGVTFVTINLYEADVDWWDDHYVIEKNLRARLPKYDQALSTLIDDLATRGLLENTLVVAMGEFGRGPRIDKHAGRGHWPRAGSALLAGGGIRGGRIIGATTDDGGEPKERAVSPGDILSTIYRAVGVDSHLMVTDRQNRPLRVVEQGEPILELF